MSFGMAFFSITMLLGIAGFHMSDLRHWDLSSKGIMKTYYDTQARVIRYYENMRLVYEIESRGARSEAGRDSGETPTAAATTAGGSREQSEESAEE